MSGTRPAEAPVHGHSRRALNIEAQMSAEQRARRLRAGAFVLIVVAVLGGGVYLASSDLMGQRGTTTVAAAMPLRVSMDGFDPRMIDAKPGQTVTLDWWNTDGAMHLTDGVHSMVSDTLGINFTLPAESRKTITITAPTADGEYDFWCDSCCGGKDNPKMHGTLHVAA